MPIFFNQKRNYFILTNYKVMYSTLLHQECLELVLLNNIGALKRFIVRQRCTKTIILTRNPYTKLISLFEDKFVRFPAQPLSERLKYGDNDGWQVCQKVFFPYLNISKDSAKEIIATKLKKLTFKEFIYLLPNIYRQEIHYHPQISILQECQIHQVDTIKMENMDLDYMQNQLGLNLSLKLNQNLKDSSLLMNYFTSSEMLETVNNIYQDDFVRFDYHQYHSIDRLNSPKDSRQSLPNWLLGI